jgi:hypothetical protein
LLQETWRPQVPELPFGLKETPIQGQFVNVSPHGFRQNKHENPWPLDSTAINIFVFGGSTAFGYGVADKETISSHLADILEEKSPTKKAYVYNFARGGHRSNLERMVFEKLLTKNVVPTVAIFIDGLNDYEYPEEDGNANRQFLAFISDKPFV